MDLCHCQSPRVVHSGKTGDFLAGRGHCTRCGLWHDHAAWVRDPRRLMRSDEAKELVDLIMREGKR